MTDRITMVAIGPNAYGVGTTVTDAVKMMKRHLPEFAKGTPIHVAVYCVHGFMYVSDVDGSITYEKGGACVMVDEREITVRA